MTNRTYTVDRVSFWRFLSCNDELSFGYGKGRTESYSIVRIPNDIRNMSIPVKRR